MSCVEGAARRRGSAGKAWVGALLLAGLACLACGTPPPVEVDKRPSEIVDVQPVIEDVHTSGDAQAVAKKPSLTGVMPSSFPKDLPLLLPASLVDFGTTPEGLRSVSLATPTSSAKVRPELLSLLSAQGWQPQGSEGSATLLRKDDRTVRLLIESASSGAVYHFEY